MNNGKLLTPHRFAEFLPAMQPAEYESLKANIQANGLIEPIITFEGKILDGRHRHRACRELGTKIRTSEFDRAWGSPLMYVVGKANHRNLTPSQKACVVVEFLGEFERLAKARQRDAGKSKNKLPENFPEAYASAGDARDCCGAMLGVSGKYVSEAKMLLAKYPALFKEVFEGESAIYVAAREARRRQKSRDLEHKHRQAAPPAGGAGDRYDLSAGDCVELMRRHLDSANVARARLIFADPPYNIGLDYGRGAKFDTLPDANYLAWCDTWIRLCGRLLADDGSIFVMISGKYQAQFHRLLSGAKLHWRSTVVWVETFGTYTPGNFSQCARFIHYFTKSKDEFVWHGDSIRVPSDRQSKYNDKRAEPGGKVPGTVWTEFPRLVDNAAERMPGFPTQIPQALVERIVLAASDPGDNVLDPFNGTGTTGAAAIAHRRRYHGIDIVPRNIEFSRARLGAVERERSG